MKSYYWGATAISTYLGCSAGLATFLGLAAAFLGVAAAAADNGYYWLSWLNFYALFYLRPEQLVPSG